MKRVKTQRAKLILMNFKLTSADRRLFKKLAREVTGGNVSALILKAVKTASPYRLKHA